MRTDRDTGDRDPGEGDAGDHDASEVNASSIVNYHPSWAPAKLQSVPLTPTPTGKQYLDNLKASMSLAPTQLATPTAKERAVGASRAAWSNTPEVFRKLIAKAARLPNDVVGKKDRELTESEKIHIRAAAKRLMEAADAVFAV